MKKYLDNLRQYQFLLSELVKKGIKLKYRRSYLGILWSMLEPLLSMVVLTIVFGTLYGNTDKTFPVYILSGRLLYSFYSSATKAALKSIRSNAAMIKKVYVPKYLFPVSKVCSCFVNLVTSFIALVIVIVATGTKLSWTALLVFIPVIYVFVFSLGMGLMLSALVVTFRDLQHLYGILITAWMYMTPIFYPVDMLPEWVADLVRLNPLANFIEMFRDVILYNVVPSGILQAKCIVSCVVALGLGFWIFYKQQDTFILKV